MARSSDKKIGTPKDVFKGLASHTRGGLVKADLMLNKRGKVVSIKKHALGLKALANLKR